MDTQADIDLIGFALDKIESSEWQESFDMSDCEIIVNEKQARELCGDEVVNKLLRESKG